MWALAVPVVLLVGWWLFSPLFRWSEGMRVATPLSTEGTGVWVLIGGSQEEQRAEDGLRLYDGDQVRTTAGSYAVLHLFDGSVVTLDGGSVVHLREVIAGVDASLWHLALERGQVWLQTNTGAEVARLLETPLLQAAIPARSRAIVQGEGEKGGGAAIFVFDSSGMGIELTLRKSGWPEATVIVGEGQQFGVTQERLQKIKEDQLSPYDLRDVLSQEVVASSFYQWNVRRQKQPLQERTEIPAETTAEGEQLAIFAPLDGAFLQGSTVLVRGKVGSRVTTLRVNGYSAPIVEGNFEKEVALPEAESFVVEVQAEDRQGLLVATKTLSLKRDIRPPDPPRITSPGGSGATVQVFDDTFEIVGEASADVTGILVNGYQLQKYTPGRPWRYLVDPAIGNVKVGENTYEVIALDRSGNRSTPSRITILWKAQPVPTFEPTAEVSRDERTYRARGSLRITAPVAGTSYETKAEEVLIEGETSPETAVISINGFTLSKYLAGKTTWNYIAAERFGNYRKGKNLFAIVARNAAGQILDVLRYTIERR